MIKTIVIHAVVTIVVLVGIYLFWSYVQWNTDWLDVWNWTAGERAELFFWTLWGSGCVNVFVALKRLDL